MVLYQADFLEGCYDDWAILERERLRESCLGTLERLVTLHRQRGEYERALTAAQRLVAADPLREAIDDSPAFDGGEGVRTLAYLDDYLAVADEILLLDVEIGSKLNEFDLQAQAIDPISEELIALADAETQRARERIIRTSKFATTLLAVAVLAAVALAGIIGLALNNSITRNVVKLTRVTV